MIIKVIISIFILLITIVAIAWWSFEIPRDDQLINKKTWEKLIEIGPTPKRDVSPTPLAEVAVKNRALRQNKVEENLLKKKISKQILFGDTHVHTSFSQDAFAKLIPVANSFIGAFPPSDACDYARYISQLDFYFLTDHAKSYTPATWQEAIATVRNCNKVAGDPKNPDLVAFMGYEWTQVGGIAEEHYGHHNVLYKDTDDASLPPRPISALRFYPGTEQRILPKKLPRLLKLIDFKHREYYGKHDRYIEAMQDIPLCPEGVNTLALPLNCLEYAQTPGELYKKIAEFGVEPIVIPHGMAWGNTAPPNSSWDHYFEKGFVNNETMRLLEVYSGHGNSEEYRNFTERTIDEEGNITCPLPQDNFYPTCRRAGDIIQQRCLEEGNNTNICNERSELARQYTAEEPTQLGWLTVPGSDPAEWLDAGQCRDCFLPAFAYRPKKSAQYSLAKRGFNIKQGDDRFRWGFVGSTDSHRAAAGNGFKQKFRLYTSDSDGAVGIFREQQVKKRGKAESTPREVNSELVLKLAGATRDQERLTSFLTLGGLAAVHSNGRDRDAIWDGLKRRETYATSGHRILLWFNLISEPEPLPMGSSVTASQTPKFQVSAVGSFKQLDGCPEHIKSVVSNDVLQRLGLGECYNPSNERLKITRIDIIRIRPQINEHEPIADLIEDVWQSFPCDDQGDGCQIKFDDPEFLLNKRDAVYYVRAIEEATPTINGGNLRTMFDQKGKAESINPCYGDERTSVLDECHENVEHRAWSSPIFVDYGLPTQENLH